MSKTKPVAAEATQDEAEALLLGLIQQCHAVIHDSLAPAVRDAEEPLDVSNHVRSIVSLADAGCKLSDAIRRLRGGGEERPPELRQRITVERLQSGAPVPALSHSMGEGV